MCVRIGSGYVYGIRVTIDVISIKNAYLARVRSDGGERSKLHRSGTIAEKPGTGPAEKNDDGNGPAAVSFRGRASDACFSKSNDPT